MIDIRTLDVQGFKPAIKGMRNPLNSWDRSDSNINDYGEGEIGSNDYDLMKRLCLAGIEHRKFMRMIQVWVDITAPMYWWSEFDTYKVGTTANSTSKMHKLLSKEFEEGDFSFDKIIDGSPVKLYFRGGERLFNAKARMHGTITDLNALREIYINWDQMLQEDRIPAGICKKDIWYTILQLLPNSYNQTRTVSLNYEVLANIYRQRKDHKLSEWYDFCKWCETLPYSELITGEFKGEGGIE